MYTQLPHSHKRYNSRGQGSYYDIGDIIDGIFAFSQVNLTTAFRQAFDIIPLPATFGDQ